MQIVLIMIHLIIGLAMVGVILLQKSEGTGLSGLSGGSSGGGFLSVRGTADLLTRTTSILAALFMGSCLLLTILATPPKGKSSIFDVDTTQSQSISIQEETLPEVVPEGAAPAQ